MAEKRKINLEESMQRLEAIISELEEEKLPLDKSLKLYEEGIKLVQNCNKELEGVKRKIQILQQGKNGEIELADVPDGAFDKEPV